MSKLFLFLLLFTYNLFACATCALMVPTAEVDLKLDIKDKTLNNIDFTWSFSDIYTEELKSQYDKNKNNILDANELKIILDIKKEYLQNKDMLTSITFINIANGSKVLKPDYKNYKLYVKDKRLILTFDADIGIFLEDKSKLFMRFEDDEGFFVFNVANVEIDKEEISFTKNIYLFTANLLFSHSAPIQEEGISTELNTPVDIKKEEIKPKEVSSFTQENILKKSIERIKALFESIKDEQNPFAYISLLLFAYMYGVIHALGPGHGKTLVASYFLTNDKSYSKALFISLAIGVVHTFSAFLLTVAIYFFLDVLFAQFVDNAVFYTTKISAMIIIFIAVYLLLKKHKAYKEMRKVQYSFSTAPHPNTCGCGSCKVDKDSTDAALIISAGVIPCPGTITIFIFSLSLGLYYAGFLAALVMSLGMSTIIFFSAILSVLVRKKTTDNNVGFKKFLEYGSLIIILTLGLILLFA